MDCSAQSSVLAAGPEFSGAEVGKLIWDQLTTNLCFCLQTRFPLRSALGPHLPVARLLIGGERPGPGSVLPHNGALADWMSAGKNCQSEHRHLHTRNLSVFRVGSIVPVLCSNIYVKTFNLSNIPLRAGWAVLTECFTLFVAPVAVSDQSVRTRRLYESESLSERWW